MSELLSLDRLVPYLVEHNAQVVSILVILIILFSMFLGFRGFLQAKNAEKFGAGDSPSMAQLEETLKKLLDRADLVPTAAQAGAGVSAENTMLLKEIEDLKNSLAEKQVQMEQLERKSGDAGGTGGAGLSADEKTALSGQVKDLQARLAEYEIISEDIADLSFFREENVKLQKELDALKKSGGAAPAAAAAPPAPAAPAAPVAPAAAAPQPAAVAKAAPAPAAAPITDADEGQDLVDKLLEQANSISTPEPSAIGASSDLDVDKMVAEAANMGAADAPATNALEENLDSDKLLAEAAGMEGKINPEDAKLMGEFEDFMKKGGVG